MTSSEFKAVLSLSIISSLRMIGLFMVLPLFALYAIQFPHATPTLVGLSMGIYGLTQAIFQIPFGTLSDHYGRKPIITIGLLIFVVGSIICAHATSIYLLMFGRALQGMGAVGGTLLAFLADLTQLKERTKAMAIAGISIGASFSIAMVLGPLLNTWFSVSQLFYISSFTGLFAILLLYTIVPPAPPMEFIEKGGLLKLLLMPGLFRLNAGIFILNAIFTATFVVLPINLVKLLNVNAQSQWHYYLPSLLVAGVFSLICLSIAERKKQIREFFLISIIAIAISMLLFCLAPSNAFTVFLALFLLFGGYSILSSFLPSLVSRAAPAAYKGSALGLYSCGQFSGIFVGGFIGGWLNSQFSYPGVFLFCFSLSLLWFFMSFSMQKNGYAAESQSDFIQPFEQVQSESS